MTTIEYQCRECGKRVEQDPTGAVDHYCDNCSARLDPQHEPEDLSPDETLSDKV